MTFCCSARVKNQISDPALSIIVFIAADAESLRIAKPLRRLLAASRMLRLLSVGAERGPLHRRRESRLTREHKREQCGLSWRQQGGSKNVGR